MPTGIKYIKLVCNFLVSKGVKWDQSYKRSAIENYHSKFFKQVIL